MPFEADADEAVTRSALELLGSKRNDAYEAALTASREDPQAWWADTLASDPDEMGEGEEAATADVEGLRRFLEDDPRQVTAPILDGRSGPGRRNRQAGEQAGQAERRAARREAAGWSGMIRWKAQFLSGSF